MDADKLKQNWFKQHVIGVLQKTIVCKAYINWIILAHIHQSHGTLSCI